MQGDCPTTSISHSRSLLCRLSHARCDLKFSTEGGEKTCRSAGGGIELKDVGTKTHHNNALFRSLSKSIPLYLVSLENLGGDVDSTLREIEKWDRPHKEPKKTNTNENFVPSTLQLTSTHDILSQNLHCAKWKNRKLVKRLAPGLFRIA